MKCAITAPAVILSLSLTLGCSKFGGSSGVKSTAPISNSYECYLHGGAVYSDPGDGSFTCPQGLHMVGPVAASQGLAGGLCCTGTVGGDTSTVTNLHPLDDLIPADKRLCGRPSLAEGSCGESSTGGIFFLTNPNGQWKMSSDAVTYRKLVSHLSHSFYPNMCVQIDDWSKLNPEETYPIAWFIFWDDAAMGISVSNQ